MWGHFGLSCVLKENSDLRLRTSVCSDSGSTNLVSPESEAGVHCGPLARVMAPSRTDRRPARFCSCSVFANGTIMVDFEHVRSGYETALPHPSVCPVFRATHRACSPCAVCDRRCRHGSSARTELDQSSPRVSQDSTVVRSRL
jgi:hypothetical protein